MDLVSQDAQQYWEPLRGAGASTDRENMVPLLQSAVANVFGVTPESLLMPNRGTARIALGRQVAMYFVHVHLGLTLTRCGELFGRDRTTVAHACEHIENLRDERDFDQALGSLERAFHCHERAVQAGVRDASL